MREDTSFFQCLFPTPFGEGRGEDTFPIPKEEAKISTLAFLSFFCLELGGWGLSWSWLKTFQFLEKQRKVRLGNAMLEGDRSSKETQK